MISADSIRQRSCLVGITLLLGHVGWGMLQPRLIWAVKVVDSTYTAI